MKITIDDNLYIRSIQTSDANDTHQLIIKNKDYLSEWLGWVRNTKTVEDRKEYIKEIVEEREKDEGDDYLIIVDDEIVGTVGYWFKNEFTVNMGYWLSEDMQGLGYVTRSCKAVIEHLFTNTDVHRLEIKVAENNSRSRALIERLGLTLEGVLRDVDLRNDKYESEAIYSILKDEYRGNKE